jgi:hypothetical protein
MTDVVHECDYSDHRSLHIKCDNTWTEPTWDEVRVRLPRGVYMSDDRRMYTFEPEKVTCPKCKAHGVEHNS